MSSNPLADEVPDNQPAALTEANELFRRMHVGGEFQTITEARRCEQQIAKLVAQVAAEHPNTEFHADALSTHEYALLALSRISKRKDMSKKFRDAAYAKGAESVNLRLLLQNPSDEHGLGTVFAAYNLGIDLIMSENRPQEGLDYMLKSRELLRALAGKKKLPANILGFKLFSLDWGIAKAFYDLGRKNEARALLKRSLRLAPPLNKASWSDLRGIAKMSELLAQIQLDELEAQQQTKVAAKSEPAA